ncbi:hypothetical protein FXF52_15975 [Micromonospora sp. MP36]|nr:hypothetical protein FXF52_15975 [Micromonospora sp. MP36]
MGARAVEWVAGYHDSIRDLPIAPRTSAAALRELLAEPLPVEGRDFADLLTIFRDVIVPGSRHNGHPRFFGYVSAPGIPVAAVADFLASALNANLPAWRSAPAPVELEHVAIDWIKRPGLRPGRRGPVHQRRIDGQLHRARRRAAPPLRRRGRRPRCGRPPGTAAGLRLHRDPPLDPQGRRAARDRAGERPGDPGGRRFPDGRRRPRARHRGGPGRRGGTVVRGGERWHGRHRRGRPAGRDRSGRPAVRAVDARRRVLWRLRAARAVCPSPLRRDGGGRLDRPGPAQVALPARGLRLPHLPRS